jgi:hypothetical protein
MKTTEAPQQTVHAWLRNTKTDLYHCGTFKPVPHWQERVDSSESFFGALTILGTAYIRVLLLFLYIGI